MHRGRSKPRQHKKPDPLLAKAPNEIYSWDITYLISPIRGQFYYLYLVMDIFSRKIVGWEVHDRESAELSSALMERICKEQKIPRNRLTIHSDNGGPMKGATLLATLDRLGVTPSRSRPRVSNDNPYSESLFNTCKGRPDYPDGPFATLEQARAWVANFVAWYNTEHLHSEIRYVTPDSRHAGLDVDILSKRHQVYERAKSANPARWSGDTRDWTPIRQVHLNHVGRRKPAATQVRGLNARQNSEIPASAPEAKTIAA